MSQIFFALSQIESESWHVCEHTALGLRTHVAVTFDPAAIGVIALGAGSLSSTRC